jgi:hypothetical protein
MKTTIDRCVLIGLSLFFIANSAADIQPPKNESAKTIAGKRPAKSYNAKAFAKQAESKALTILIQPETRVVEVGTFVTLSVVATPSGLATYRWKKNGTLIPGADAKHYSLPPITFADVAAYQVEVSYNTNTITSDIAYVSVYQLNSTNSNGGTLTSPIGVFASYAYTCNTVTFDRGYCPQSSTAPYLFYGPYANPQSGPFVNSSASLKLDIDTNHPDNSGCVTGIRLVNNWSPPGGVLNTCAAKLPGAVGAFLSSIGLSTYPSPPNPAPNTYRATILYQSPGPASGKVSINWMYHQ